MTVVSCLKLNDKSGIICADERETHGSRVYDVAKKITELRKGVYVSFAGSVSNARHILESVTIQEADTIKDISERLSAAYRTVRNKKFSETVLGRYGLTIDDLKDPEIDREMREKIRDIADDAGQFGVVMVLGGYDNTKNKFEINVIHYPGTVSPEDKYTVIGSGSDRADLVIGDYLHNMKPEEREKISIPKGCRILMEATQSAWRNLGVGGGSQIVWVDGDKTGMLERVNTTLLHNALYCEQRGYLDTDLVNDIFDSLIIREDVKPEDIINVIKGKISPEELLKLFFQDSLHI